MITSFLLLFHLNEATKVRYFTHILTRFHKILGKGNRVFEETLITDMMSAYYILPSCQIHKTFNKQKHNQDQDQFQIDNCVSK